MSDYHMEICIDSIESAKSAIESGANRLEVCSALSEGGLTPSPGLLKYIKTCSTIPVYAMIRIRNGNFIYSQEEIDAMLYDLLILRNIGVDGFVFGALNCNRTVDIETCGKIISAAKPIPVTFHRAFDETNDPFQALEHIIDLGFVRILTSGQRNTALEGVQLIAELIIRANNRILVMPGCGIGPDNIELIKQISGAKEFHASARICVTGMQNNIPGGEDINKFASERTNSVMIASGTLIKRMMDIIKN